MGRPGLFSRACDSTLRRARPAFSRRLEAFAQSKNAASGVEKPASARLGSTVCEREPNALGMNNLVGRVRSLIKATRLILAVMTLLAADTNAGTQEQLATYRQQIDSLDQRIVELLQERARVVEKVGAIKREAHLPVTVPGREQEVIEKAQELAMGGPLPAEAIGRIYQKLVEEMRNWEAKQDASAPPSAKAGGITNQNG